MTDYNAYIDESGDRGWRLPTPGAAGRTGSSRVFAMTAVLVPTGSEGGALALWRAAAAKIGRRPGDTVHWVNVKSHSQRRVLSDTLAAVPNLETISVILCKHHLQNAVAIRNADYLYGWTFRLMVERLSWFGQSRGGQVHATFAQVSGLVTARLRLYVGRLHREPDSSIQWAHLKPPFRIDTPKNRAMLQLADSGSGAVTSAFQPDPLGYTEQRYLEALSPNVWRRPGREVWKDGLKYGPWPSPDCGAEYPWFDEFCRRLQGA